MQNKAAKKQWNKYEIKNENNWSMQNQNIRLDDWCPSSIEMQSIPCFN